MARTHGLVGTYSSGCRCDQCREAWRVYANERRANGKDNRKRGPKWPWRGKAMAL